MSKYYLQSWKELRASVVSEPTPEKRIILVREDVERLRASLEAELRKEDRSTTGMTANELGNMSSKEIETKINNLEQILGNGT